MNGRVASCVVFAILLAASHSSAMARGMSVYMQNLSLGFEFISMRVPWVTILHEYQSRTLYENSLGTGWCNMLILKNERGIDTTVPLDKKASIAGAEITINICGNERQFAGVFTFSLDPKLLSDHGDVDLKSAIARLGREIKIDGENGAWLTVTPSEVVFSGGDGDVATHFDWNGNTTAIGSIQVEMQKGTVSKLSFGEGAIRFQYQGVRLISLRSSENYEATFKYDRGNLAKIDNAWQKEYEFTFNDLRNLESVRWPDQTQVTVFYDEGADTVATIMDRDSCTEEYSHISGQNDDNYKVQAVRSCFGKQVAERTVTYHFNGGGITKEVNETTVDGNVFWLDAFYGKP